MTSPAEPAPVAVVVGADPDDTVTRLRIATELRAAGLAARADLGRRKLGKQLEAAARDGAHFAVIVGDELATGEVGLRDLPAGTQKLVAVADLSREIARAHAAHRHGGGQPIDEGVLRGWRRSAVDDAERAPTDQRPGAHDQEPDTGASATARPTRFVAREGRLSATTSGRGAPVPASTSSVVPARPRRRAPDRTRASPLGRWTGHRRPR